MLRLAQLNDLERVMAIVNEVVPLLAAYGNYQWDHTYPNATVFTQDIGLGQLWVCEVNGSVAGAAAITTEQEPEYGRDMGYHRQGVL